MPAVSLEGAHTTVVHLVGELDLASCDRTRRECTAAGTDDVAVDLTLLTFLDCAGYRALNDARLELLPLGRRLTLVNANGQPQRVLQLIGAIERPSVA